MERLEIILVGLAQASPDLSLGSILDLLSKGGLLAGLVIFVYLLLNDHLYTKGRHEQVVALYKDRIVSIEKERDAMRDDRDDWRAVAKERREVVDDAVELAATRTRRRRGDAT